MTTLSTANGVSLLAHGLHYALTVGGLLGVLALLMPQLFERRRRAPGAPRDGHELRVARLRADLNVGTATTRTRTGTSTLVRPADPVSARLAQSLDTSRLLLPLAVVGSTAAAGVHAAVGPAHFAEGLLFGLFFALSSVAQLGWTWLVLHGPSARLLMAGAAGNVAIVGLWAVTRTWGLPGLLPTPEAIGLWDVAAGCWELVTAGACLALVRDGRARPHVAAWARWHPVARVWVVGSVVVLGVLSLSGAKA